MLKKEIKNFSSTSSLEAIARNNLKMAGDDEVLVIINESDKKVEVENPNSLLKTPFILKKKKFER